MCFIISIIIIIIILNSIPIALKCHLIFFYGAIFVSVVCERRAANVLRLRIVLAVGQLRVEERGVTSPRLHRQPALALVQLVPSVATRALQKFHMNEIKI